MIHAARIHGLWRGAELHGDAELVLEPLGVALRVTSGGAAVREMSIRLAWEAVEGVQRKGADVVVYLAGDDALELTFADQGRAHVLVQALVGQCCELGEQTLPLRGLGSRRANPGSEHERFYGPLLAARRGLEDAEDIDAQLRAFGGEALGKATRETLAAFAAERFPDSAADRRALEAELLDHAAGLLEAIGALRASRDAVKEAPADVRLARWRVWAYAVRSVFVQADRAWLAMLPALADSRGRKGSFWRRLLRLGAHAWLALALPAVAPAVLRAQGDRLETVRVPGADARALAARGFDIVFVQDGVPLVIAGPTERARLAAEGFVVEPLRAGVEARRRAAGIAQVATPTVFRPFEGSPRSVRAFLDSLAAANPQSVHLETLGESWEGRPVLAAKLGSAADDPSRPNVVFMATYHAREWIATEVALRLLRHLVASPDARTRQLVDRRDVWVVPVVNPDGYQYSFTTDRLWRKNRRVLGPDVGVDLNRNHDERWGYDNAGSSPLPPSETYRGPSPSSEPEVRAVEALHDRVRPVASVSYHSFSDLLLYPPGFAFGLLPQDLGVYRALAGTDARPAILDRVPGSVLSYYHPGPGWQLYPTNGEFTDWASARHGTLAFTPELTSGCEGNCTEGFYGFEFPDDEARVAQVFADNLPFALDLLEAAADPVSFRSPSTGMQAPRVGLESVWPQLRIRTAPGDAAGTVLRAAPQGTGRLVTLVARGDTVASARWERRLLAAPAARPRAIEARTGGRSLVFTPLLFGGAEAADTGWALVGVTRTTAGDARVAGSAGWELPATSTLLTSPVVRVPADVDTVTVSWWHRHFGNPFTLVPRGELRVSRDGGAFVREVVVLGQGPVFYPEHVMLTGVAGRTLQLQFANTAMRWIVDEVAIVAHGGTLPSDTTGTGGVLAVLPSENPVRGDRVRFQWPAGIGAGELAVYDFAGRLVWRRAVADGTTTVEWSLDEARLANGAYLVQARAGGRTRRLTLYVARAR